MSRSRVGIVGRWVRLKRRVRRGPQKARIVHILSRTAWPGAVSVEPALDGFNSWSMDELVYTTPPKRVPHD